MLQNRPFMIALEGNIAAGKSTILDYLSTFNDVTTIKEPLEKWCNFNGKNLLQKMYNDEISSLAFQSYIQTTRFKILKTDIKSSILIVERSLLSNQNIFLKKDLSEGKISQLEIDILRENEELLNNFIHTKPDVILYLQTDPETAYKRLKLRDRSEEKHCNFKLLKDLHSLHEKWLNNKENDVKVEVINANIDIVNLKPVLNNKIQNYKKMLATLKLSKVLQARSPAL